MLILRVAMFWFEVKALAVSSKYYASSDKGCNGCDRKTIAIKRTPAYPPGAPIQGTQILSIFGHPLGPKSARSASFRAPHHVCSREILIFRACGASNVERLFLNPNMVNRLREEMLLEVSIENKYCKGQGDRKMFGRRVQEANKSRKLICAYSLRVYCDNGTP